MKKKNEKIVVEIGVELTDYEIEFRKLCKRNKIIVKKDEDGCPVVFNKYKKLKEHLKLYPWGKDKFAFVCTSSKDNMLFRRQKKKLKGIPSEVYINARHEGIILFESKHLKEVAKALGFKMKREITEEERQRLTEMRKLSPLAHLRGGQQNPQGPKSLEKPPLPGSI